ncbi:F-box protein At5g50450-like [Cynara cardunculus var. scolymus]|uniref:F-box domain, cyclin-like protein n=1 Tax=Cynara cardunculus var. scolymus TaxID=59895 RepID=A0A103XWG5_CYNCS|nr:F-box protein At5g50450-like [Cynara cardunculus var. scolymus]KVH98144.1 F-box domain, cyclin-like protein [Cynara cardunculus var. scolymus]
MTKKLCEGEAVHHGRRRRSDLFESLPDEIVISILCKLSSTSSSPSDFVTVLLTCKRLNKLGVHPLVLSNACSETLAVRAKNWSDEAHRFLKLCVNAGNKEAYYTLGMIRFYCLQNRGSGASLMAKAAIKSHAPALYSLALIQFNGSGGLKNDKDLRAGVALCARAAFLGHADALRELGHCLQDGYGVQKNVEEGRRLLVQANARELSCILRAAVNTSSSPVPLEFHSQHHRRPNLTDSDGYLWPSDDVRLSENDRCNSPGLELHPANRFLVEWFGLRRSGAPGLRLCSYGGCGRPETRRNEFRRCSGCGTVNYCSRGCQAHDWRVHHKVECAPMEEWMGHAIDDVDEEEVGDDDRTVEIEEVEGDDDGMHV